MLTKFLNSWNIQLSTLILTKLVTFTNSYQCELFNFDLTLENSTDPFSALGCDRTVHCFANTSWMNTESSRTGGAARAKQKVQTSGQWRHQLHSFEE